MHTDLEIHLLWGSEWCDTAPASGDIKEGTLAAAERGIRMRLDSDMAYMYMVMVDSTRCDVNVLLNRNIVSEIITALFVTVWW